MLTPIESNPYQVKTMSGLILVSHNLHQHSVLSSIYDGIMSQRGGIWVSWNGDVVEDDPDALHPLSFRVGNKYDTLTFPLTHEECEEGYHGYVYQGLWPVFHQRPDLARFTAEGFKQYLKLNETYARAVTEYAMPDDAIWIQDYHLIPSIKFIRDTGLTNRIGFCFHQSFPAGQSFEAIPDWHSLIGSLLCCDLIGFQTVQDMNNFLLWVETEFRIEHLSQTTFRIHGRIISTGVFPVGIDTSVSVCLKESNSCRFMERQCKETLPVNIILSGGHLDDITGFPNRIRGMDILLKMHPEYAKSTTLLQLTTPSMTTQSLESALKDELKGLTDTHAVSFISQDFSQEELCGIYRASRVALVTPLMAGMSLMARMYVASQDSDNPGVLILSQFAGGTESMKGAIIVNPYDPNAIADALNSALKLPLAERKKRHAHLLAEINRHDNQWWADSLLTRLDNPETEDAMQIRGSVVLTAGFSGRIRY